MKLFEVIKNDTKKRSLLIGISAAVILTTVVSVCVAASIAQQHSDNATDTQPPFSEETEIPVFLPMDDTEESENETDAPDAETAEPLDLTGINGIEYVSLGNGTCYVNGIGSCTETTIKLPSYSPAGDKVVRITDSAFENCSSLLAVYIPETVNSIGMGVFRGCSALTAIVVEESNQVYSSLNGVLYSKNMDVLVCVPGNLPESALLLSESVTVVAAYALEGVKNLRSILYTGSIQNFSSIEFLEGNDLINSLSITCNYTQIQ